ncbi:MAG TPA: citramalate synthase [Armatimonadota bacterium]|jgi:2-isopropylmalate synthase
MRHVRIYDTTLRDGAQAEGISFTVADKIHIARKLDDLGVEAIEGGWPGSNPKDVDFFREAANLRLKHAKLTAFGSTRRAFSRPQEDAILKGLVDSDTPILCIFGKSWDLHVEQVLRTTLEENVRMIRDSVAYLKSTGREVIYDAEHFFNGYQANPAYALECIQAAAAGGADLICLCDTNGGMLPWDVEAAVKLVSERLDVPLGIHTHDDSNLGTACAIAAVRAGAVQVQGTMNGWGERVGNANLCSIIPVLQLKMGCRCLTDEQLATLTEVAHYIGEIANTLPNERQAFIGRSAFAHKAGTHVDAVMKVTQSCEHISPEAVGNQRRFLISELSGGSSIISKAREAGFDLTKNSQETREILSQLVHLENDGYVFEGAEASFELLMRKATGSYEKLFDLLRYAVEVEKQGPGSETITRAVIKVNVHGEEHLTVAEGNGPVNALDGALRKALREFYPELDGIRLTDFKVRVVDAKVGTAAKVRVLVESQMGEESWSTIGVSPNVVEASWDALVDAIEYGISVKVRGAARPAAEVSE